MLGVPAGRVNLAPYSDQWPQEYALERDRIERALGGLARGVEHVGSTAVRGLIAKPLIDMLVGVRRYEDWRSCTGPLTALGYVHRGDLGIAGRQFFTLGEPTTHHVHLCEQGGRFWYQTRLFREHLRKHPEVSGRYSALKLDLAQRFACDRAAYTVAKGAFVEAVLREAGWEPGM